MNMFNCFGVPDWDARKWLSILKLRLASFRKFKIKLAGCVPIVHRHEVIIVGQSLRELPVLFLLNTFDRRSQSMLQFLRDGGWQIIGTTHVKSFEALTKGVVSVIGRVSQHSWLTPWTNLICPLLEARLSLEDSHIYSVLLGDHASPIHFGWVATGWLCLDSCRSSLFFRIGPPGSDSTFSDHLKLCVAVRFACWSDS